MRRPCAERGRQKAKRSYVLALLALVTMIAQPTAAAESEQPRSSLESDIRDAARDAEPACTTYIAKGWLIHETDNFRICSLARQPVGADVAAKAEALRAELAARWLGDQPAPAWRPKCDVILHHSASNYLQAVPGGGRTSGATLIEIDGERIAKRQIDLRADLSDWLRGALAHETMHVILADLFPDAQVPRWADEGIAMLADTPGKQRRHAQDLEAARLERSSLRLVELLSLDDYPPAYQQGTFYGQSASVVAFLVERETPQHFVRAAMEQGYETALAEMYQIDGIGDLERRWLRHLKSPRIVTVSEFSRKEVGEAGPW